MGTHQSPLPGSSRLRLRRGRYSFVPQSSHSALHLSWRKYPPVYPPPTVTKRISHLSFRAQRGICFCDLFCSLATC